MKRFLLAGVVLLLLAVVVLGLWLQGDATAPVATAAALVPAAASAAPSQQLPPAIAPTVTVATTDAPLPELPATSADAVQSMSLAREAGDARAPSVVRDAPRDMPSAAELADPQAYQRYEARQNQRLQRAYVKAADTEIPRLQQDIARAREAGLTPEQIAEGEEKLRRIQSMRDQLQAQPGSSAP